MVINHCLSYISGLFPFAINQAGLDAGRDCVCRVTLMAFGGMLPAEAKLQGRMFQRKALMSSEELVFLRRAAVNDEATSAINGQYSTVQPRTVAMSSMAGTLAMFTNVVELTGATARGVGGCESSRLCAQMGGSRRI